MIKHCYIMLLTNIVFPCFAADQKAYSHSSASPDREEQNIIRHSIKINGNPLLSRFNFSDNEKLVRDAFMPRQVTSPAGTGTDVYDIREFEKQLRIYIVKSERFPTRFRGAIGLLSGLVIGGAAALGVIEYSFHDASVLLTIADSLKKENK